MAFRFSPPKGKEVEYKFPGQPNGWQPAGALAEDANGNLYGTTNQGGKYGAGEVFKIDGTTGKESILYSFTGGSDGCYPYGVILDSAGNLYGVTEEGGGTSAPVERACCLRSIQRGMKPCSTRLAAPAASTPIPFSFSTPKGICTEPPEEVAPAANVAGAVELSSR